jgi:hypothetical protein
MQKYRIGNIAEWSYSTWIISPSGCHILFNLVFAYLFEHSLIAVDVNQSLHENLGGYFWLRTFWFETIALVLHAKGESEATKESKNRYRLSHDS